MITIIKAEGTSKFIDTIIINDQTQELVIKFLDQKAVLYYKVPQVIAHGFENCEDLGKYFNFNVYGQFSHSPIELKEVHRKASEMRAIDDQSTT